MKFGSYQPAVEKGTLQNVPLWRSRDVNAYGGRGEDLSGVLKIAQTAQEIIQKQQDEADAADVMAARNRIMTQLTADIYGENGLYATGQGRNAAGLMNRVTQRIHDVTAAVGKEYNGRVQRTLLNNLRENALNMQRNAAAREFQEFQQYKKNSFLGSVSNNNAMAGEAYADKDMFEGYVKSNDTAILSYVTGEGWSGDEIAAARRKYTGEAVAQGVAAAMNKGDDDGARALLEGYRTRMEPTEYRKLMEPLKKRQEIREEYTAIDDIWKASGGNLENARALLMEKYGPNATRTVKGGSSAGKYDLPTQSDDITAQVEALRPQFRSALPYIGGILNSLGVADGAQISSGARSFARQMEVNPDAPNSYHVYGDAIDIVLPDGISEKQAEKVKEYFEDSGAFEEVLYHDAGSGYHLHLGGYKGGLEKSEDREISAYDPEKLEKAMKVLEGKAAEEKRAERESHRAYLSEIDQALSGMSWEAGQQYLDEQNLTITERNRFDAALRTANGISRRAGGGQGSSASGGVTAKTKEAAERKIAAFGIDLSNGNWIKTNQFVTAREAGYKLEEAGLLSEEEEEELTAFQNSPESMHILTLALEGKDKNIGTAYDDLVKNGMTPKVAAIVISRIAPVYLSEHYQDGAPGPEYEDKEEE